MYFVTITLLICLLHLPQSYRLTALQKIGCVQVYLHYSLENTMNTAIAIQMQ